MTVADIDLPEHAEIAAALREALTVLLPPEDLAKLELDEIDADTRLLRLPIDSALLMALTTELENRFKVYISEEQAFAFVKVGDIADHIRAGLTAKAVRRKSQA